MQPAPAPRFSRTVPDRPRPPMSPSGDDDVNAQTLSPWGFSRAEVAALRTDGAFGRR